jgi:hypothetical protein
VKHGENDEERWVQGKNKLKTNPREEKKTNPKPPLNDENRRQNLEREK